MITHHNLETTIRIVSDPADFYYGGNLFHGVPFELALLTDDSRPPRASVTVCMSRFGVMIEFSL